MGECLSKVGAGDLAPKNPVNEEMLQRIGETLIDVLVDLPEVFQDERRNIIWEMWRESPEDYEDEVFKTKLNYKDFPDNDKDVAVLAVKITGGSALKEILGEIVHSIFDPEIEEAIKDAPPAAQNVAMKAADKAIETAIEKAVDKALKELNKKIEEAAEELLEKVDSEGFDKESKPEKKAIEKMKNKKKNKE